MNSVSISVGDVDIFGRKWLDELFPEDVPSRVVEELDVVTFGLIQGVEWWNAQEKHVLVRSLGPIVEKTDVSDGVARVSIAVVEAERADDGADRAQLFFVVVKHPYAVAQSAAT